jgi:hypothetical protein
MEFGPARPHSIEMPTAWVTFLAAVAAPTLPSTMSESLAFYGVVATVLPVLFIALVFQARFFEDDPEFKDATFRLVAIVVLSFFGLQSEFRALLTLATHEVDPYMAFLSAFGLIAVGLALVLGLWLQAIERLGASDQTRNKLRGWAMAGVWALFIAALFVLYRQLHLTISELLPF